MVRLLSKHVKVTVEAPTVSIQTWGHVAASHGPDPHCSWSGSRVRRSGPDLLEHLLSNGSFEPFGYKLKGYWGMAEVEHLGGLSVHA
jgi:hypothetical protein